MIYAANFKMNHTRASTAKYIEELSAKLKLKQTEDRVIVFPPATALDSPEYDLEHKLCIGAQNAYPKRNGAYTGEIGLEQLEEFGIKTILIGHSERRTILGESQDDIVDKFSFFKNENFEIIYCIGEPLEVREQGLEAVLEYLLAEFNGIDIDYKKLIIAYEPIWAIGTGRSATVDEISSTHAALKKVINKPLLYGGSVKPDNIKEISEISGVDGVLVGSAALKVNDFLKIIRN